MSPETPRCKTTAHKAHMCSLQAAGNTTEIERLSNNPAVECGVCGAKANCVDNVCTPAKVYEDEQIA
jgi:transcription elongation factor Elf1